MWAWLIQRAAAIGCLVVIALHLVNLFRRPVQAALLALALLHALLGVRSLLLDFGLPLRWHRALFVPRPPPGGRALRRRMGVALVSDIAMDRSVSR